MKVIKEQGTRNTHTINTVNKATSSQSTSGWLGSQAHKIQCLLVAAKGDKRTLADHEAEIVFFHVQISQKRHRMSRVCSEQLFGTHFGNRLLIIKDYTADGIEGFYSQNQYRDPACKRSSSWVWVLWWSTVTWTDVHDHRWYMFSSDKPQMARNTLATISSKTVKISRTWR